MSDNYYIPDISEFHVGFTYEAHRKAVCPKHELEWIPIEFGRWNSQMDSDVLKDMLTNKLIRVRLLSISDIEEIEFVDHFNNNEFIKICKNNFKYILRFEIAIGCIIIHRIDIDRLSCVFAGKIKNKTELGKVLKMLNI